MNSINFALMEELENLLETLERDDRVRSFILTGSGEQVFISGGDLKEFHAIESADEARSMARRMLRILERIERLPCWTIASINGATYGGGCETMLAFDFRIASADAIFGFTQGKFYLPPGWGGLTRLVERVGRATALGWLAEAAVIDTETALRHTLIDRVASPGTLLEETRRWAGNLGVNDRTFIQALKKRALDFDRNRWDSIAAELDPFSTFWEDERHRTRVENFLNRGEEE